MEIRVMKAEDYDKLYELWMTIKGFGIRSIDDSQRRSCPLSEEKSYHQHDCLGRGYPDWCHSLRT